MDAQQQQLSLPALQPDALQCILQHLDYSALLAAGSSCRALRDAATAPPLWRRLCDRRWSDGLNAQLYGSIVPQTAQAAQPAAPPLSPTAALAPQTDYRSLFLSDNGWAAPRLAVARYAGVRWADEIVAVAPAAEPDGGTTITVSSCRELRVLHLPADPGGPLRVLRAANTAQNSARELWSSVAALPAGPAGGDGWVAAGGCHGRLVLFQLPESSCTSPSQVAVRPAAVIDFPGDSSLVSSLQYLPATGHLAVLHDPLALLRPSAAQRSSLSLVDARTWRLAAPPLRDLLDGYELAAAAAVGDNGAEFVAGSVKESDDQASGWACRRCYAAAPAALCFHKSPAAAACLCVFDARCSQAQVGRYSTGHRSLYPHLVIVRGHYLLSSHAGTPALHLSATSDLLLGRADNGMCWLFDLSERLGWADGSHGGSWLPAAGAAAAARRGGGGGPAAAAGEEGGEEGRDMDMSEGPSGGEAEGCHLDEWDFERAPLPLGVVGAPCEVWCSTDEEAAPLHWLPPPAAWIAHNRLVALGGLELDEKQRLFPAPAQGNPYPSNALVAATLRRPGG
ncbi:F-box only 3 isoform X2 [Micractinium conductrix]|uniref:F-box only 3 isoform X2 n=1 Tax=Micractinium conductrix TaxID=554055 RepID=A0A2P6VCX7_9CHLO|nr:F-box only 3 isoform X2 [Micractinium conductrix]|eukprot:PSC71937.1 F-box only 3 isoform X2 [Micractinium conductrix]